jgi:hypothetical protein
MCRVVIGVDALINAGCSQQQLLCLFLNISGIGFACLNGMKTTLLNLRLEDTEIAALDELAGRALNRQAVARMLLQAAIEAVRNNQGRLNFPPCFSVTDPPQTINRLEPIEPKPKARK